MEKATYDGIIHFTEKTYRNLVLENPRPYDVVIFFTVSAHCDLCE